METANESVKKEVIRNHDMRNKEWIEFTESIVTKDNKLKKNVDEKKWARRKQIMWVKNKRKDKAKKGRKYELKNQANEQSKYDSFTQFTFSPFEPKSGNVWPEETLLMHVPINGVRQTIVYGQPI